ncbi:MAG TPA: dienelactone hydrolase family protein [Thermoanaerobaculia bacterium]|nr:dienelactone hydrolase family protein [Thermoanaerobaculia bacterium]
MNARALDWSEKPWGEREIDLSIDEGTIHGALNVPSAAMGLVIFPQGSGSSRHSRRNRALATMLQEARLATLVFDLLTEREERIDHVTMTLRLDVELLARRLGTVTAWVRSQPVIGRLPLGYFGASTGAAAALVAAARNPRGIRAAVSRSSRPDLAGMNLPRVRAPILFIVGGEDLRMIRLNEEAMKRMRCTVKLEVVPGAGHLFEEPGTLARAAELAVIWFAEHLPERSAAAE